MTAVQGRSSNLPKVTKQQQWLQAPAVTTALYCPLLPYTFPVYWFKSSYGGAVTGHNDFSTQVAARLSAEIFCPLWVLELLGNCLVPWRPFVMSHGIAETLRMRYFFRVPSLWILFTSGCQLCSLGKRKIHIKFRIAVIPWKGERRKVLETGKQETSPLIVGSLCLLVCILFVCFKVRIFRLCLHYIIFIFVQTHS